jgi:hypothetical protein
LHVGWSLINAGFRRVFTSLSDLCFGQPWLGQSDEAALLWLAGLLIPFIAKTLELVTLPTWVAIAWMAAWALLGYVIAPYGMWKHQRAQNVSLNRAGGT